MSLNMKLKLFWGMRMTLTMSGFSKWNGLVMMSLHGSQRFSYKIVRNWLLITSRNQASLRQSSDVQVDELVQVLLVLELDKGYWVVWNALGRHYTGQPGFIVFKILLSTSWHCQWLYVEAKQAFLNSPVVWSPDFIGEGRDVTVDV